MASGVREGRLTWMLVGLVAGVAIATIWPHEPVQAVATDRAGQFALCTGNVNTLDPIEGVFTLDFLTGDLKGAVLNRQGGIFTAFYYRNITGDFTSDKSAKPTYAMVTGNAQLPGQGGGTPATTLIYVAELTSGKVVCYKIFWRETRTVVEVQPIFPVASYPFREPLEQ